MHRRPLPCTLWLGPVAIAASAQASVVAGAAPGAGPLTSWVAVEGHQGRAGGGGRPWPDVNGDQARWLAFVADAALNVLAIDRLAAAPDPTPAEAWTGAPIDALWRKAAPTLAPTRDGGGAGGAVAEGDADADGVPASKDCDDGDPTVGAGQLVFVDQDGDGYGGAATVACPGAPGVTATGGDCDDTSAAVHPAALERCDPHDVDEDCDGLSDDADPSATGKTMFSATGDGAGDPTTATLACSAPSDAPTWSVWDRGFRVMTIVGRPGPVISMAAPPPGPGASPRTHPFLSATSSSPPHEDRIGRILAASTSLETFLKALEGAGFVVREEEGTPP